MSSPDDEAMVDGASTWTDFVVGIDPSAGRDRTVLVVRTWGHVFQAEVDPHIPDPYGLAEAWRRIGEMMADHVRKKYEEAADLNRTQRFGCTPARLAVD